MKTKEWQNTWPTEEHNPVNRFHVFGRTKCLHLHWIRRAEKVFGYIKVDIKWGVVLICLYGPCLPPSPILDFDWPCYPGRICVQFRHSCSLTSSCPNLAEFYHECVSWCVPLKCCCLPTYQTEWLHNPKTHISYHGRQLIKKVTSV